MRKLTNAEKIVILEGMKKDFEEMIKDMEAGKIAPCSRFYGFCYAFTKWIITETGEDIPYQVFFPDFTYKNALLFGANRPEFSFWWSLEKEGFNCRLKFLDWMINWIIEGKEGQWNG
jgi:hypothetical protein